MEVDRRFDVAIKHTVGVPIVALTLGRKSVTLIDSTTLETTRIEIAAWEKLQPLETTGLNRRQSPLRRAATPPVRDRHLSIKEALHLLKGPAACRTDDPIWDELFHGCAPSLRSSSSRPSNRAGPMSRPHACTPSAITKKPWPKRTGRQLLRKADAAFDKWAGAILSHEKETL